MSESDLPNEYWERLRKSLAGYPENARVYVPAGKPRVPRYVHVPLCKKVAMKRGRNAFLRNREAREPRALARLLGPNFERAACLRALRDGPLPAQPSPATNPAGPESFPPAGAELRSPGREE